MNVVNLGQVKDLAAEWEKVRKGVVGGRIRGFYVTLMGTDGEEVMYCGGVYKTDPKASIKAALRTSARRVLGEDDPPALLQRL